MRKFYTDFIPVFTSRKSAIVLITSTCLCFGVQAQVPNEKHNHSLLINLLNKLDSLQRSHISHIKKNGQSGLESPLQWKKPHHIRTVYVCHRSPFTHFSIMWLEQKQEEKPQFLLSLSNKDRKCIIRHSKNTKF